MSCSAYTTRSMERALNQRSKFFVTNQCFPPDRLSVLLHRPLLALLQLNPKEYIPISAMLILPREATIWTSRSPSLFHHLKAHLSKLKTADFRAPDWYYFSGRVPDPDGNTRTCPCVSHGGTSLTFLITLLSLLT